MTRQNHRIWLSIGFLSWAEARTISGNLSQKDNLTCIALILQQSWDKYFGEKYGA